MWTKFLSLLGLKKTPVLNSDLFESFAYPTMTDLTKQEHLGLEYVGMEEEDNLDEVFDIVQRVDHDGNIVDFCVLGEVQHNHGYYLVCMSRTDMADSTELELALESELLILQVFPGVGSDKVYHEIQHKDLQEQVLDAFMDQENPENR